MDLRAASRVMKLTHLSSIKSNTRANALMLESGPGIGKSETAFQVVEDLAKTLNEPVGIVQFMLATISSVDVRGFMLPLKSVHEGVVSLDTVFSIPPWYPVRSNTWVVEHDGTWHRPGTWNANLPRYGVLFLDEFGQAEDEVKKPAAELLYKGAVGTSELPLGWRVIAAQNRVSDRSGVLRELMFLVNRRCLLSIDPSLPAWLDWANRQPQHVQPHYLTMSFAQQNPDIVFRETVPDGSEPFCTPRTLCLMDKDLRSIGGQDNEYKDEGQSRNLMLPTDDLAREVCAGWIGGGAAAQFFTHLKYADQIPTITQIEADPAKAKLPEKRDAQMVCAYMLSHSITEHNATKVLKYMYRLNIEMQVLCVSSICATDNRAKLIVSEPTYVQWLMKNKDLLVASRM
jgi:hypothetical protein